MARPTVTTQAVLTIAPTTANANGTISATGGKNCDKRGFVFALASHGDPGDIQPNASGYDSYTLKKIISSAVAFDADLSGLSKNTKYYVRAWAHNPEGYSYGNEVNFTTLACVYPTTIFSPRAKLNKPLADYDADDPYMLHAPDITKLDDEVVAIETELGTSPKGSFADVKAAISDKLSKSVKDEFYNLGYVSALADGDDIIIEDASASYAKKGSSISALKTFLKTYFDGYYNNLGYVLRGETIIPAPADEDSIHYGSYWGAKVTSDGYVRLQIPKAGHIKRVTVENYYTGTQPTTETSTHYLVKNGDYDNETLLFNNTFHNDTQKFTLTNSALNISVAAGDYIEFHFDAPVWATNPGGLVLKTTVYIDT